MRVVLRERGTSLMSRQRGDDLAQELVHDRTDGILTLDFADIQTGPSFISSLFAGLENSFTQIHIVGARERIAQMARQIADRQGMGDIVIVEDVVTA